MSLSLYDILKRDIKKMVQAMGGTQNGNIYPLIMQEVERYLIEVVLEETRYNYLLAAKLLGISRSTLYRKIETLNIQIKSAKAPKNSFL